MPSNISSPRSRIDSGWDCSGRAPDRRRCGIERPDACDGRNPLPHNRENRAWPGLRSDRDHRHVGGQVLVGTAEAVAEPRAHARPSKLLRSRVDVGDRRIVIDRFGVHRADDRHLVDDRRGVRQQLGVDPSAPLAIASNLNIGATQGNVDLAAGHARSVVGLANRFGQLGAVNFSQRRLVVEHVDVAGPAGHEQVDDSLCRGRGKCGNSGSPGLDADAELDASAFRCPPNRVANAAAPRQPRPRASSCRRVICNSYWSIGFMESLKEKKFTRVSTSHPGS